MTAGYAAFQTNLKIKGTSGISSNWDIKITNVTKSNETGGVEEVKTPTWTDLTAYMEANLYEKGDSIEYDVTVENNGTIDASLDNISENIKSTNEAVKITFSGYTKGEKLFKNSSQIIKVKIEYNPDFTGTPEEGSGEISVDLNYTQAEGGTITPTDKYLVTYDCTTNGGKDCTSLNEYKGTGESINLSNTATKEGFEFLGWNTSKDATEGLTELNMLNENITLYAIFKDTTPPECEIKITNITLDNIKIKANCTDASGINKYELSESDEEYVNKNKETEYEINNVYLSKIKIKVTDHANNSKIYNLNETQLNETYEKLYELVKNKKDKYESSLLDKTYPVGSIYITESNTNPSGTIGGTWEEYGKGKTLVGVDENDSTFNEVNKTGGSKTSTLAVTNLPSHSHSIPSLSGTATSAGNHTHSIPSLSGTAASAGNHNHSIYSTLLVYNSDKGNIDLGSGTNIGGIAYMGWSLNTGSSGAHTHTVTTKANTTGSNGNHTHNVTIAANTSGSTGSGTSFTNLQPYTTVYMYKRIS